MYEWQCQPVVWQLFACDYTATVSSLCLMLQAFYWSNILELRMPMHVFTINSRVERGKRKYVLNQDEYLSHYNMKDKTSKFLHWEVGQESQASSYFFCIIDSTVSWGSCHIHQNSCKVFVNCKVKKFLGTLIRQVLCHVYWKLITLKISWGSALYQWYWSIWPSYHDMVICSSTDGIG